MVRFEENKLIIEVEVTDQAPQAAHAKLLDSLVEIVWFALENDKDDMIRKESALLAYYLLKALITTR